MNNPLLNNNELTIIRYWLNGITTDVLNDLCGDEKPTAVIQELRMRLILKARRLQTNWDSNWLERKSSDNWLSITLKRVVQLQNTDDIIPEFNQPLTYWLADEWLEKLESANLILVSDWLTLYRTYKNKSWWQNIPGLGAVTAKAIENQLLHYFPEDDAGTKVQHSQALVVLRTDVVPLSYFLLPDALNGSVGDNRSQENPLIPAVDDYQAINCWLSRLEPTGHTFRSYKREAERLLLWTILVKHKALSSLNMVDMVDFRTFLSNPQPASLWIGPPQKKEANWKPFTGPLSQRSRRFSETVINGLFNFLISQRYLSHNPLQPLSKIKAPNGHSHIDTNRVFSEEQWELISLFLDSQVNQTSGIDHQKWIRTRLIIQFGYGTGLRLHELAQASLDDIEIRQRKGKTQYWLSVLGKGDKNREVPLPLSLYLLLATTYQLLTGRQLNRPTAEHPIIPRLRGSDNKRLTPLALHRIVKEAFLLASEVLKNKDPEISEKLKSASTHWLRHTHGSLAVDRNIPLPMIRDNLGHSNISTTSNYIHANKDARYDQFTDKF